MKILVLMEMMMVLKMKRDLIFFSLVVNFSLRMKMKKFLSFY